MGEEFNEAQKADKAEESEHVEATQAGVGEVDSAEGTSEGAGTAEGVRADEEQRLEEEKKPGGEEEAGGEEETDGEEELDEAEIMARLQQEIRNLPVSDHLLYMMHSLSTLAVSRMGVTPETTGLRDLSQARMAVDAFKALMEIVERDRPAEEMTAHRKVLSELQLAYVAALDRGTAETGGEEASTPQAGDGGTEE